MAVTTDILASWRHPRGVMRRLLAAGRREDRALAFLMIGCLIIFVAQWPRLVRTSELTGAELSQLIGYEFFAWLIVWPLALYVLLALGAGILKLFRSRIEGWQLRLAFFWALLASTPGALLYGLMAGFVGPGPGTNLVGAVWIAGFCLIFGGAVAEAARQGA
ncbi:hypothetical protein [Pseudoroseicyclus tamaricis]|uniref:YIP1 family protein n=1 Tax=Pseudoroseicyclus tamaricis TaxID=2705421 RepID=A0A6B2JI02_9RHOB|nr:hypothetical protein [Pseudoroseicyclus tamaricis]NDV00981.1 hypothetical protein [Pseudoroseicyclus tamaricis]